MAYDNIDYTADHYCPAYGRVVSVDLCYDSLCCLTGQFKTYSTRELAEIEDMEAARKICRECRYSEL
ncbi:MAG: hypothetical protein HFH59_17630 [Lachnospiraceae bacterium]|nr:hypothetical protein [Lachnospiraceae bacterium]MCI9101119.1 hypothetical protein [Lachnospiraceae bacterium]MCI9359260.1 hypothetical protein [Lachnospiraceae bacterium]